MGSWSGVEAVGGFVVVLLLLGGRKWGFVGGSADVAVMRAWRRRRRNRAMRGL